MATPSSTPASESKLDFIVRHVKPFLTPYYMTVAGVLGAMTAGFVVVIVLLIIVVANFNVLGWME